MTAAELASFRALLQAQAAAPPGADRGLFARMRGRLTVVEGGMAVAAPARAPRAAAPEGGALLTVVEGPAADPPPSIPPAFGRREVGAPATLSAGEEPPASALDIEDALRRPRRLAAAEEPGTPDELADPRPPTAAPSSRARVEGPAPGVVAGWSRARPARAQRRLLGRLEAVLLAEREGLEARRAADAPSPA